MEYLDNKLVPFVDNFRRYEPIFNQKNAPVQKIQPSKIYTHYNNIIFLNRPLDFRIKTQLEIFGDYYSVGFILKTGNMKVISIQNN